MIRINRHVKLDIYEATVYITFTDDLVTVANKMLKQDGYKLLESSCDGLFLTRPDSYQIIFNIENLSLNIIAHECTHAILRILENIEIPVNCDNDEPAAYLMGYLVDRVYHEATKLGLEIKNGPSKKR